MLGKIQARARARQLLMSHLDEDQQWTYVHKQFFDVRGASGTRYRVHAFRKRNIEVITPVRMRDPVRVREFAYWIEFSRAYRRAPLEDLLLAQKLLLETDDRKVWSMSC